MAFKPFPVVCMHESLLQTLRHATAQAHAALHDHPALCHLSTPHVTRDYHGQALQGFYGFYQPLETAYTASQSPLLVSFPAGVILQHLEHDLLHYGIDPQALPQLSMIQEPFSLEQVIGYLYLREGSNLGGKVISKNLERHLNLQPGIDNRFFWGHGSEIGLRWQSFLSALEQFDGTVDAQAVAHHAAMLFTQLGEWMLINHKARHAA